MQNKGKKERQCTNTIKIKDKSIREIEKSGPIIHVLPSDKNIAHKLVGQVHLPQNTKINIIWNQFCPYCSSIALKFIDKP